MTTGPESSIAIAASAPLPAPAFSQRVFVRDVALVARFELGEALRSRLLAVMLLLFVGSGALGAWGYSTAIEEAEQRAASVMGAPQSRSAGATVRRLRDTQSYRDVVRFFVRDAKKADYYATFPPIVVFYFFAAFIFTPWLILFTSAETIASEVASRGVRYSLLRTGRFAYALGKSLGQGAILVGVTGLCALVFYLIAWAKLAGFEAGATALGLLSYWPRVVVYTLPFLSWAMFASMATSSANFARIVSLGGGVVLAIAGGLAEVQSWRKGSVSSGALDLLSVLTPFGHADGFKYPAGGAFAADLAVCLVLTVLYFAAGFLILRRRDV
jgi:ABC-type transport system involved in multi-copper enzyme maturation permease subunit